ncbi:tetraacyldisaccharide 4'-kinase [Candidatus Laterigemmans baculatus]|uniref:tetraacyldisaccharide 4'-kinase n=1 Tax=Candidatus Laterigemmans baculatus TaxID=2770505 RepID=UPI0013DB74F3|nr:tetraacyldisaccharide 4'-kinase [Candidatus Laterigemmans baculatus]
MDYRRIIDGQRRDPLAVVARSALRIAAIPYGAAVRLRNRRYDSQRLPIHRAGVPVISVGNLTAGGTGKTPMVAAIAAHLRGRGLRVGLVSRGYRSDESGSNDEARELYDRIPDVPHVQNPDRVEAARVVVEELEMEAIVLDDGFQHRRLHRDLDVVLIDATCPFGYGHLLPRGLLREPLTALARADAIVISRASRTDAARRAAIRQTIAKHAPQAIIAEADHVPARLIRHTGAETAAAGEALASLHNRPLAAFAGLGNPQPFFDSLSELGGRVIATRALADHCPYDRPTVESLDEWLGELRQSEPELLAVCTHKDLVKLRTDRLGGTPLRALAIELRLTAGEAEFWQAIERVVE